MLFSIIIPTYKEKNFIKKCIKKIYVDANKSKFRNFEIIVVDGEKNFSTGKIVKKKFNKIKIIYSQKGRAYQMNIGASHAKGEILIFLHADTLIPENFFKILLKNYNKIKNSFCSFSLGINSKSFFFRIIEVFSKIRIFFTKIPYGDQIFIISKKNFYNLKKFDNVKLLEDVLFVKKVKKAKLNIIIFPQKVKTSPRKWYKNGFIRNTFENRKIMLKYFLRGINND